MEELKEKLFKMVRERHAEIKEIPDTYGRYYVTTDGHVYSIFGGKIRDMQGFSNGATNEYARVKFYVDGKSWTKGIHQLVAQAFIANPEGKPCVQHFDSNTRNNSVENLGWCSQKENMQNSITRERISKSWAKRRERNNICY